MDTWQEGKGKQSLAKENTGKGKQSSVEGKTHWAWQKEKLKNKELALGSRHFTVGSGKKHDAVALCSNLKIVSSFKFFLYILCAI